MTKLLIFSVLHITSTFFNAKINKYIIKSSSLNKYHHQFVISSTKNKKIRFIRHFE